MIKNILRIEDDVYLVRRVLSNTTSEEDAKKIHEMLETTTLIRDNEGKWFCCNKVVDVEFTDINPDEKLLEEKTEEQ